MLTRREFGLAALSGAGGTLLSCGSVASPTYGGFFQKGINFTAERPDRYESEKAREILRKLRDYGVNSVAFVPYGWCRQGSTDLRFSGRRSWERDPAIVELTKVAHEAGMKVLLKPQIWVPRGFPGDLDFDTDSDTQEWFSKYEDFLRHYAALATTAGADLFSVGVEFSKLARHSDTWRRLTRVARELFAGPLVYAANWGQEFESIDWWDAVDYIGLNNYYPLPDDLDTKAVVEKVEGVQARFRLPVIFPEAGYPSLAAPHREPWAETPRDISLEDQARCYEAMFQAFYHKPWFKGVYWWKVGSNGFGGSGDGSHTPWGKPAMDVVKRWYVDGGRG